MNENRTLTLTGEEKAGEWQGKTIHKFVDRAGVVYSVWDSELAEEIRAYIGTETVFDVRITHKNGKTFYALDGVRETPKIQGQAAAPSPVADRIRIAEIAATLALMESDPQGRVQYLLDICAAVEQFVYRSGASDEPPPGW